ncbi:MAG: prenyltransferase/squalene oxidase repeat-containing protein [Planctomycetota bacterium]
MLHTLLAAAILAAGSPAPTLEPAATALVAETPIAAAQDGPSSGDVKDFVDVVVRWVRLRQDENGGYGDLAETAGALQAFALGPRAYTTADGPFMTKAVDRLVSWQREDGAICAADASPTEAIEQTLLAARTLALFDGPVAGGALQRAEAFLRVPAVEPVSLRSLDVDAARALASGMMERAADDGHFDGPDGAMRATTDAILALAAAGRAIASSETKGKRSTSALPAIAAADRAAADTSLMRGADFLASSAGGDLGVWGSGGHPDPGITALVVGALETVPAERRTDAQKKAIATGLAWLRTLQNEDGSICINGQLESYVTSAAIMALEKSGDPADAARVADAVAYLKRLQADEGEGYGPSHKYYGGIGYGDDERPDLSNVWMAANALKEAGIEADDEALQKMVAFLQRAQNRSESNDLVIVKDGETIRPGNDGGGTYAPGESKAGYVTLPDGTKSPRSYGSMSYALLGCYMFCGLERTDPRVQAVWKWISNNYTLDVNPGFEFLDDPAAPYQGLFYYFHSMARALDAYGSETVTDADGVAHEWRKELAGRLIALQRPDGSWINENSPRWWEGNPVLATAYAMVSIDLAMPQRVTAAGAPR